MLLNPTQRQKLDDGNDRAFYDVPRFVTHVDAGFIDRLTNLYREKLTPNTRIFDMMSSWVSHLPEEMQFEYVQGHGLNEAELAKNPRFDSYFIQNLNQDLKLPLEDASFDAVLNTVSVQYLQYPEAIFAEIYRILKPNGIAIFSFSNRMFYNKAIAAWRDGSESDRVELVEGYFKSVPGFTEPEAIVHVSQVPDIFRLIGVGGGDPFYAVIARKQG
ncbi:class I SAM-dependent methyltransferase [Chamaesiphon polymorphus]|uniref:SAM-dependent methyltransferase n=1 Tax=Chamaesiphon polymorphus CCALA 037 TaxID=2107692 RepID=A0A2T1F4X9_9CYAN|nr:class I SAM-dependent methyltransferase [Chamaesiphon polymorphus]PSB40051.1 SAM-dependent methyltransferase [Chamaesiphon polymorphus CCALA 037]